ncbi:MAG: putative toxin-antitoxin system toxin component, PIN family [Trichodesmium sp.]
MRVVLDVNVWISGWLWGGIPGQIILMAENQKITVFVSEPILQELETTLKKAKLQARIQLLEQWALSFPEHKSYQSFVQQLL